MTYKDLADFIDRRMRMSHVYQPVMLIEMMRAGGVLKDEEIAKKLLARDQSQIDYYRKITNQMPGDRLKHHGVVSKDNQTKEYSLIGFESLSEAQIEDLIERCQRRLDDYIKKRGCSIYQHRKQSSGYISGTLRYEILKRAKFRCELCGISAEEKALEADHIIPRSKGGSDDLSNLQALCYSCNAMKRDRDDTDFRSLRDSYAHREEGCIFCSPDPEDVFEENELAYAFKDGFAVTEGHCLIIPKRHVADYFDLGQAEINACQQLIQSQKNRIQDSDSSVTGFNVGVNVGSSAGQTVFHCHTHLIPRRGGDIEDPTGGVRNVIPGAGKYSH